MISGLLIIILERTSMIGVLKSLGCSNFELRKVFLYVATFLIGKGLVIGNIIGIGLCLIQHFFHVIKLDPENYYLE
ncbi:FtsX-like permease family protein, partial [Enterococcus faecium]